LCNLDTVRLIPCGFSFVAYNKDEIIKQALQVIEDEQLTRISEVICFIPIASSTFYEWELEKSEEILSKINEVKVKLKHKMKRKWSLSDNPALAIAAFKLIADEDEADALNTSKVKQDTKLSGSVIWNEVKTYSNE
jgi:hypothetical protein